MRMEVPKSATRKGDITFLSVEQCAAVLPVSGPYLSAVALALFAGLRPRRRQPWPVEVGRVGSDQLDRLRAYVAKKWHELNRDEDRRKGRSSGHGLKK